MTTNERGEPSLARLLAARGEAVAQQGDSETARPVGAGEVAVEATPGEDVAGDVFVTVGGTTHRIDGDQVPIRYLCEERS